MGRTVEEIKIFVDLNVPNAEYQDSIADWLNIKNNYCLGFGKLLRMLHVNGRLIWYPGQEPGNDYGKDAPNCHFSKSQAAIDYRR